MKILSLKAIERIFQEAGAKRISKKAKVALKKILEEKGRDMAKYALRSARHSGRKQIQEIDVEEAERLRKSNFNLLIF